MTTPDDFESGLGTALRDRTDHVHPDLEGLATAAFRAGVRIRRRRRAGALAGATLTAGVLLGAATAGSHLGGTATEPGFAAAPGAKEPTDHGGHLKSISKRTTPPAGPYDGVLAKARSALSPAWSCGTIGDDKFPCTGAGAPFSVIARPKSDLAQWQIKGSVEATQVAWIGQHCFLTVQGPSGTALDALKATVAAGEG